MVWDFASSRRIGIFYFTVKRRSWITETCERDRHLIPRARLVVITTCSVEFAHVRRYAYAMGPWNARRARLGWSLGWLVGYFVRCGRECLDLAWPDLHNFAPYPYLPTYLSVYRTPFSLLVLPAYLFSPLVTMLPFQRSVARLYPSGKPTLFTYLRSVERGAMFLLAHPFSALRHPVSLVVQERLSYYTIINVQFIKVSRDTDRYL